jgi:hypothetical protein
MTRRHALKGIVMAWPLMLAGGAAPTRAAGTLSAFGHRLACTLESRAAREKVGLGVPTAVDVRGRGCHTGPHDELASRSTGADHGDAAPVGVLRQRQPGASPMRLSFR